MANAGRTSKTAHTVSAFAPAGAPPRSRALHQRELSGRVPWVGRLSGATPRGAAQSCVFRRDRGVAVAWDPKNSGHSIDWRNDGRAGRLFDLHVSAEFDRLGHQDLCRTSTLASSVEDSNRYALEAARPPHLERGSAGLHSNARRPSVPRSG